MVQQDVIQELNAVLEGNYMAIEAYENYIQKTEDQHMKEVLQQIQQEHKRHSMLIAERIQDLGGRPVEGTGLKGKMVRWINQVKGRTQEPDDILRDAIAGEKRGIELSRELVEGDLDEVSLNLIKDILQRDEQHIQQLQQLLHSSSYADS